MPRKRPRPPARPRRDIAYRGCWLALAAGIAGACDPARAEGVREPIDYVEGRARFSAAVSAELGLEVSEVAALLAQARWRPEIVAAMERPYEAKPWYSYRRLFVTPERIAGGVAYWRANAAVLARAADEYGVPAELLVAILGVETNYGRTIGSHRALDALTTLGFSYPKRSDFFLGELKSLLLLAREERVDPARVTGSYAGALGKPQFIPSSYRAFAVDFDGDGLRDLWRSDADVLGSVANYFKRHGWRTGEPVAFEVEARQGPPTGIPVADRLPLAPSTAAASLRMAGLDWREPVASDTPMTLIRLAGSDRGAEEYWAGLANFYVITRYNHSNLYAMAVYQLGRSIRERMETVSVPAGGGATATD